MGFSLYVFLAKPFFNKPRSPSAQRIFSNAKPGSCTILEEKYCAGVKLIKNPNSPDNLIAAFNVPNGTLIFAPNDGYFSDTVSFSFKPTSDIYSGAIINTSKDTKANTENTIFSLIYFKEDNNPYPLEIKKGQIIGKISGKKISALGDYNLIFAVTKQKFSHIKAVSENDPESLKKILNIKN